MPRLQLEPHRPKVYRVSFALSMRMKRPRVFYGWWIVGATMLVGLYVGGIIVYGFTAIFEPIIDEFGWSYATVSFAASLRGAETGLLEPIVGRFVDRWGSKPIIFVGGLFTAGGLFMLSHTTSLAMFYGSFILLAVGMSACGTTSLVTGVANWFRRRLGLATGMALCGFGLGGLVLPAVVALIAHYGWRTTYDMLAVGALILLLPISFVFRHRPEDYGYLPDGRQPDVMPSGRTRATVAPSTTTEPFLTAREALKTRAFWLLTLAFTVLLAANITVVTHIMPYLDSIGISRVNAGIIATAVPLLSIGGRLGLGALGDRMSRTWVTIAAFWMMGLGLLCFAAMPALGQPALYAFLLFFGVGYGGIVALRPAMTREYFGRGRFGSIFGLVMGITAIGGIVGPPLTGRLFDTIGDYRPAWLVFGSMALTAACLVYISKRYRPRLVPPQAQR